MRLTKVFFILILVISTCLLLSAQDNSTALITKSYNNTPIANILNDFKSETNINIYFKNEWLKGITYSGVFTQTTILTALNKVFENTPLNYITIGANIYVLPREEMALILNQMTNKNGHTNTTNDYLVIGDLSESGKHKTVKINGLVKDGATGAPLVGSVIIIENTDLHTVAGYNGNYAIEVPTGIYRLKVTSMGYEDKFYDIKAVSPGSLEIEMFEESHSINEVVISSERRNKNVSRMQMSMLEMNSKTIKELPSLVGEPDIIKSFTTMPGVKSASEFGSGINVRGGSEDQNLFLIENCPIYNTSHVMGLLSVLNPDAVNKVALYKGHIPIEYGERVSSVMNIKTSDPTIDKLKVKGGIGIYSSRLLVESPLFNDLVKLKIGGRSSYSDYLLKQMPDYNLQNSSASFYDITGTALINLKNNPITLFAYYSYDNFKYASDYSYKYGNSLLSLSWTHRFNSEFTSNINLAYSKYQHSNEDRTENLFSNLTKSNIKSTTAKLIFDYNGLAIQKLNWGLQGIQYKIKPGNRTPIDLSQSEVFKAEEEQAYELSGFVSDEITISSGISISLGLRYTQYNYLGPRKVYTYLTEVPALPENIIDSISYSSGESIIAYGGFEPRASIKFMTSTSSSIKLSYNRNKQYLSLLSHSSISTPEDTWKLADNYLKPVIADQLALGYYQNFNDNNIEASVEFYIKELQNLTEYRNGAQLKHNKHIETELLKASGNNYGIEFFIKKKSGKLNGSLSYTYSRAWKQTNGKWLEDMINENTRYPSQYDIPHELNINANYKLNRRVRFGTTFSYATGRPVTLPEYTYNLEYSKLVYYSDRNKYRLPDYHRLDISLSVDESLKKKKKWKGSWTFSILNVYGRKNAYSIFYKKDTPTPENNYQVFSLYKLYLIGVPTPTVTYNFIF